MRKVVIFNVGGASSAYVELDDVKFMIDLGGGNGFSPVNDFLIPLAEKGKFRKDELKGKFILDQLFLSHLDNDHISNYEAFMESFEPSFITAPNDNPNQVASKILNRELLPENKLADKILDKINTLTPGDGFRAGFHDPLISCSKEVVLSYIDPVDCEKLDDIANAEYSNYANNISLLVYINLVNSSILFSGDIMPDGFEYLINNDENFRKLLVNYGVDFFVTPHHGLDTSFSDTFFETVKGNKVGLNIMSEKAIKKSDSDNRHNVDQRYYNEEYSYGKNVIDGVVHGIQKGIITSVGHIVIDFGFETPRIKRCYDNENLLLEFI